MLTTAGILKSLCIQMLRFDIYHLKLKNKNKKGCKFFKENKRFFFLKTKNKFSSPAEIKPIKFEDFILK